MSEKGWPKCIASGRCHLQNFRRLKTRTNYLVSYNHPSLILPDSNETGTIFAVTVIADTVWREGSLKINKLLQILLKSFTQFGRFHIGPLPMLLLFPKCIWHILDVGIVTPFPVLPIGMPAVNIVSAQSGWVGDINKRLRLQIKIMLIIG